MASVPEAAQVCACGLETCFAGAEKEDALTSAACIVTEAYFGYAALHSYVCGTSSAHKSNKVCFKHNETDAQ